MKDVLGPSTWLGYCTNVHSATTFEQICTNFDTFCVPIRQRVSPVGPMGIGLWLPAAVARQIVEHRLGLRLADLLAERGLVVFTLNGFPYGDFHGPHVKHQVYQPDWTHPHRLQYTLDLITILSEILQRGGQSDEGGISTLPIGWGPADALDEEKWAQVAGQLLGVVNRLEGLEQETGRLIHLDLEPEPGCVLTTSADVVRLFEQLEATIESNLLRRYLRVCYDICHAAVMFEDHAQAIHRYRHAGIQIGKAQISSALKLDLAKLDDGERAEAVQQLAAFEEDRYLHQTVIQTDDRTDPLFFEDLPQALSAYAQSPLPWAGAGALPGALLGTIPGGQWRVHFHVPLFLERSGHLETTQDQIVPCLRLLQQAGVRHFEVETYAWDVLPAPLRCEDLTRGVARELQWLMDQLRGQPA